MTGTIDCWALTKRFNKIEAVAALTLKVAPGELFGLLGPNGAGKSTLVKMLVGLIRPSSGWAEVNGFPPGHLEAKADIGYLPELFRFPEWMTGEELLRFHGALLQMDDRRLSVRLDEVLELVGLSEARRQKIGTYSKGMQQRLGLAQAVLGRPKVLFLDEPASALDPVGRVEMRDLLVNLSAQGTTIFLNSHLLTDIEMICHRAAVLNRGRIVKEGTISGLTSAVRLSVKLDRIPDGLFNDIKRAFGHKCSQNGGPGFYLEAPEAETAPRLTAWLVGRGFQVYEMATVNVSLEEMFVEAVKETGHE